MRSSLRNRLLITFLVLVLIVGAGTLFAIERTLANDLVATLDARMTKQGRAVAEWLIGTGGVGPGHPDARASPCEDSEEGRAARARSERLATRLAAVTGARITIIGADGMIYSDSAAGSTVCQLIGNAFEVSRARRGEVGRAIRELHADEAPQYLVAVPAEANQVIRLAVPLGDVIETRARMRYRLLVGAGFGFLGCLLLSWIFIRAITRPLQSMTRTAEKLARGEYDAPPPADAGGELGLLARAMGRMAGEVKARVGELTQQRDLLTVVFGGLVEGVVVVNRSRAVVLVNEAARPLLDDDELPAGLRPLVDRALAGEQADKELELSGRAVRASARPLGDPGAIVVLYDVTRMRALESVRREFLSNAAHELRTPVTSISGYAETLLAGQVDGETSREFLQTIHRNAERISGLVNDLLVLDTLGGRASAVTERVALPLLQVVNDAVRTAKGVTPGAAIDVTVAADLSVLGTRDGLDHVVQNLIDNAIKYGNQTRVTVHAERIHNRRPPSESFTSLTVVRRVRVSVSDRGPGIPRGHEERVFERFYRIDAGRSRDRGGSGLGLAIVKSQVEAMGGRVWLEHAEPGARFVVELDAP